MEHFYNEVNWVYHNGKGFLGGHAPSERRKWAGATHYGADWLSLIDHDVDDAESYDASAAHLARAMAMTNEATAWGTKFLANPRGWLGLAD